MSTGKREGGPVAVVGLHSEPDEKVIAVLEEMLAEAKSGKLRGLAAVTFEVSGARRWQVGYWAKADALWAFEHMKHELLHGGG